MHWIAGSDGLPPHARLELLERMGVPHAIFGRLGGYSQPPFDSLNTGHTVGDALEAVEANMARICQTLGVAPDDLVTARLVHGTRVAVVGPTDRGRVVPATDGLCTASPEVVLFLRFADCVPLFLFDTRTGAVGLGHAGWKGTVEGMAAAMVRAMQQAFGSRPQEMVGAIGPAIGPCCYEVGPDVEGLVCRTLPHLAQDVLWSRNGRVHFDLWEANRRQLVDAGVAQVEVSAVCTACRRDLFFSHRADRGRTGRFGVAIRSPGPAPL